MVAPRKQHANQHEHAKAQRRIRKAERYENTLLRFYVAHIMVLPLVAAVFLAVHFWRIRKDGGISGPL